MIQTEKLDTVLIIILSFLTALVLVYLYGQYSAKKSTLNDYCQHTGMSYVKVKGKHLCVDESKSLPIDWKNK